MKTIIKDLKNIDGFVSANFTLYLQDGTIHEGELLGRGESCKVDACTLFWLLGRSDHEDLVSHIMFAFKEAITKI